MAGIVRQLDRSPEASDPGQCSHLRSGRLLGQDGVLELHELGAGIETQLVGQVAAGVLVGLERLALTAVGVQGEHEQAPQPFAPGLLGGQAPELADRLPPRARGDAQLKQLLERLQAELLEPLGLAPGELLSGEVAEGRARPRRGTASSPLRAVSGSPRRAPRGPAGGPLEAGGIELVVGDRQPVAGRRRAESIGMRGLRSSRIRET